MRTVRNPVLSTTSLLHYSATPTVSLLHCKSPAALAMIFPLVLGLALLCFFLFTDSDSQQLAVRRQLKFNDVNFLHTTDTHGWYSGHINQQIYNADWGKFILFAKHLKSIASANGQDLLLVDSGDRHDGNGLSDITLPNGEKSLPIFMRQHYDIITLGNHELYLAENSEQEVDVLIPHFKEHYICSNVEYTRNGSWHSFGEKYRYFSTPVQGVRILSFAFLFDFNRNNVKTRVTSIADAIEEDWFLQVLQQYPPETVDMLLIVGHLPITRKWSEVGVLHAKLRTYYPETKIQYFGGHSHIRDFVVYDDELTGLQSGRFCETVGFLSMNMSKSGLSVREKYFRSYIDFNQDLFMFHSGQDTEAFDTCEGKKISEMIHRTRRDLGLDAVIGKVKLANYYMDYVPLSHPHNIFNLLTKKVLHLLVPLRDNVSVHDERLVIINTGSVRYDLYKGDYTTDTHYIVSPFKNDWVKVSLPKRVATRIAPLLNRNGYIMGFSHFESKNEPNRYLLPPHQRFIKQNAMLDVQQTMSYPRIVDAVFDISTEKLSKGYITYDDFGSDGDDTKHKGVVKYPLPNVVQSLTLKSRNPNAVVDVIFYNFLLPNIQWALKEIGEPVPEVEFYSDKYLGVLLDEYVQHNEI